MPKLLNKRWLKTPTFGVKRALSHDFRYPICTIGSRKSPTGAPPPKYNSGISDEIIQCLILLPLSMISIHARK